MGKHTKEWMTKDSPIRMNTMERWKEIDERRKFYRRGKFLLVMCILIPLLIFTASFLITVRIMEYRENNGIESQKERIMTNSQLLGDPIIHTYDYEEN